MAAWIDTTAASSSSVFFCVLGGALAGGAKVTTLRRVEGALSLIVVLLSFTGESIDRPWTSSSVSDSARLVRLPLLLSSLSTRLFSLPLTEDMGAACFSKTPAPYSPLAEDLGVDDEWATAFSCPSWGRAGQAGVASPPVSAMLRLSPSFAFTLFRDPAPALARLFWPRRFGRVGDVASLFDIDTTSISIDTRNHKPGCRCI